MSWFSTSSGAPDVPTNKDIVSQKYSIVGATTKTYANKKTTTQKEKRGMTLAVADSVMATLAADSTVSDISRVSIGGGGYNVRYTVTAETAWAEV